MGMASVVVKTGAVVLVFRLKGIVMGIDLTVVSLSVRPAL
jgi:hypothetical protein